MSIRSAVVTGSSGFIGRALCRRLREAGWSVLELGGRAEGCDVSTRDAVLAQLGHIPSGSTVFHLAGRAHEHADSLSNDEEYRRINVEGTRHVLELASAADAARFVLASSVAVYGAVSGVADEQTVCSPVTAYARTKLESEALVRSAAVASTILRFPMVYGGVDRGNMTRIVSAVRRRRFPPLPTLDNRRSVLHVENAADALLLVATSPVAVGETFVVTDKVAVSTSDIYRTTLTALGRTPPAVTVPLWALRALSRLGDGAGWLLRRRMPLDSTALAKLTESAEFSSRKIQTALGFAPERTLEQGIRTILDELA